MNCWRGRSKEDRPTRRPNNRAKELRAVETEIANIKQAVKLGKATGTLLEMLEDSEERRNVLLAGHDAPKRNDTRARLEKVLAELPERVQAYLEDLEILLARKQIERGKNILAGLGTEVLIHPNGIEIRGDLRQPWEFTLLVAPRGFEPLFRP